MASTAVSWTSKATKARGDPKNMDDHLVLKILGKDKPALKPRDNYTTANELRRSTHAFMMDPN